MTENRNKPYTISIGTDNRPGGVEGEYHLQFKPDIMNVTFGEQEEVAKEFGGTMRVTNGQEWADFYHEADAVKFAEKVIGMNQERETAANKKKEGTKITVKGSHGKVLNLIPSDDPVKNRIVETLKDRLIFHDAESVDDVLDKTKDSYEMKVWNRLNKDLWEIAYRKNNTDIRLNISSSDDLSKIKVVEHERRYYGQSDIDESVGDFDLKEMPPVKDITEKSNVHPKQRKDDVSKISFFKSESGKNAGKYILYWEDDKGKNHRVYDLLDQKERFIVSAFFKAIKEGRREEFLNDLVSKLSKAQKKDVKKDEAVKFAEKVVDLNQERLLQARFDAFKAKHGDEPLYAEVTIRWKDDGTEQEDIIKLSDDIDERDDDKVFFNVTGLNDLKSLINPDNGEDFYIVDVQDITFQPKSLFLNDEKAVTVDQIQEKAVKLFGNNFEFDYWNETQAGTKIDRIDLGEMPDTISIDKLEIKDGKLSLYSNDIASDVDLQALDDIELSKVDVSLDEIKGYLISSNKEKDLVNRYQAAGMGNGTQLWPDRGTLGAYQAYAFKDNKILVFKDADDNKGVLLSSLPHEEQERLMDAIGTLLDRHLTAQQKPHTNINLSKEILAEKIKNSSYWTDIEENNFPDKVVFNSSKNRLANGEKILCFDCEWEEIGDLHIVSYFNPNKRNLYVTEDGFLVNSKVHTSTVKPAYLTFEKTDTKVFDTTIRQDQQQELSESKTKLFATILEAKKDLGDHFSIVPTEISENGDKHVITEILPDFESPFEDQNIIGGVSHSGDEDCVHNLALCLENVNDAESLGKAVHEAHVKHLEQDAKQAIHDRIVTPSARRFTSDQVEVLNRYHQVAAQDKPAGEVFKELLQEMAQNPDVARKPEKWVADTAKELDTIAEGITRTETRGLHK
jgi:hypothetical protein